MSHHIPVHADPHNVALYTAGFIGAGEVMSGGLTMGGRKAKAHKHHTVKWDDAGEIDGGRRRRARKSKSKKSKKSSSVSVSKTHGGRRRRSSKSKTKKSRKSRSRK